MSKKWCILGPDRNQYRTGTGPVLAGTGPVPGSVTGTYHKNMPKNLH